MISILRQRAVKHLLLNIVKIRSKYFKQGSRNELYFGYGANLSIKRLTDRKMNVKEVGNAVLPEHQINFTLSNEYKNKGYAGVHQDRNSEVWGVVYEMDSFALNLLDTLEWCGFGAYERKRVKVLLAGKEEFETWCYFVKYPKPNLYPSKIYLMNMIKSAKERRFPISYVDFLEQQEYKEDFEIDYGYSLLFYGQRRILEKELQPLYKFHDKIREKLCELL